MKPITLGDVGVLAGLALLWIGVPAWIGYKLWSRRKPGRMEVEPVESNLPRARRDPVTEIEAEPIRDYRGPGRKGEPFFQVGGVGVLVTVIAGALFSWWFSDLIRPWVDWLVPMSPR